MNRSRSDEGLVARTRFGRVEIRIGLYPIAIFLEGIRILRNFRQLRHGYGNHPRASVNRQLKTKW